MYSRRHVRGSAAGNILTVLLLLGVIGLGAWFWLGRDSGPAAGATPTAAGSAPRKDLGDAPDPIEPVTGTPVLEAANAFTPSDNTLRIDISEYAGYGGLIVANGGLDPNPDSFFAKEYGFKVAISMSESETWSPLNNGKLAATATTADALAVLNEALGLLDTIPDDPLHDKHLRTVTEKLHLAEQLGGLVNGEK